MEIRHLKESYRDVFKELDELLKMRLRLRKEKRSIDSMLENFRSGEGQFISQI
jgi:hypothetical protein